MGVVCFEYLKVGDIMLNVARVETVAFRGDDCGEVVTQWMIEKL